MAPARRWLGEADQEAANRQTQSLAGLAVALLIVVAGLYLARALHREAMLEDCFLAGRLSCEVQVATAQ